MDTLIELWQREDPFWATEDLRSVISGGAQAQPQARPAAHAPDFSATGLLERAKQLAGDAFVEATFETWREAASIEASIGSRADTLRIDAGRTLKIFAPDAGIERRKK